MDIIILLTTAFFYGLAMKIADLLDEHGLKWFRGNDILFGVLWGGSAAILIYLNPAVANIILAMNLAFLVRGNIDYPNHALAVVIVILNFTFFARPLFPILFGFLIIFLVLGTVRDKDTKILAKYNSKSLKVLFYNGMQLVYGIPTLIYSIFSGRWIIFWTFFVFAAAYDATKYIARKRGYK